MAKYKTIAGPVELHADGGLPGMTVGEYARIINAEAVDGWELHLIEQVSVRSKGSYYPAIAGAIIGIIIGWIGADFVGLNEGLGLLIGGAVGALLGFSSIKTTSTLFNMLIFVNNDDQQQSVTPKKVSDNQQRSDTPKKASKIGNKWQCSCGHENAEVYLKCSSCGKAKNQQQSEELWQCSCGSDNLKTRLTCRHCGNPKS